MIAVHVCAKELLLGCLAVAVVASSSSSPWATAFLHPTFHRHHKHPLPRQIFSGSSDQDEAVMTNFESWFNAMPRSNLHESIRHAIFAGKLRGLSWQASASSIPSSPVVSVPLSVVLQSSIRPDATTENDDWDSQLAQQLWTECQKGAQSTMVGYCNFLMSRADATQNAAADVPPSTAPNALRRWTSEERNLLESKPAGQKLLQLEQDQQATWKRKHQAISAATGGTNNKISWEHFQWAMEVVHSRAFRGNFGSNTADSDDSSGASLLLPTVVPPLGAALAGWFYTQNNPYPSDLVLAGLAFVAMVPLALNVLTSSSNPPSAVLLPIIDSANHKEDADSSIAYDPLTKCFQMSIGPQCLVSSTSSSLVGDSGEPHQQLCISYGMRSDSELLLNYGFVPGAACSDDDAPLSVQRERLAKAFLDGNS